VRSRKLCPLHRGRPCRTPTSLASGMITRTGRYYSQILRSQAENLSAFHFLNLKQVIPGARIAVSPAGDLRFGSDLAGGFGRIGSDFLKSLLRTLADRNWMVTGPMSTAGRIRWCQAKARIVRDSPHDTQHTSALLCPSGFSTHVAKKHPGIPWKAVAVTGAKR
jgi:hypothetical protein